MCAVVGMVSCWTRTGEAVVVRKMWKGPEREIEHCLLQLSLSLSLSVPIFGYLVFSIETNLHKIAKKIELVAL